MVETITNIIDAVLWIGFLLIFHKSKRTKVQIMAGSLFAIIGLIINIELISGSALYSSVTFWIDLGILILYSAYELEGKWYWKGFTILLYDICLFSCNFFCLLLFTTIFQIETNELIDAGGTWRWCFLLSSKSLLLAVCLIILYLKDKFANLIKWTYFILVLPALIIGIVSLLMRTIADIYCTSGDMINIIWLICLVSILFVICVVLLSALMREKEQKIQNRMLKQQMDAQEKIYSRQYKSFREVRKYQHDLKHKMIVVEQLLFQNDSAGAEIYLKKFLQEIEDIDVLNHEETVWKTLLSIKAEKAKELDINYEADIRDKGLKRIDPVDICIVLGNLLDNAIEAEEKVTESRAIKVKIREEKIVYILVANKIVNLDIPKGHFRTTKGCADMHGFGLECIQEVVHRYNGVCELALKDGWFQVEILF